MVLYNLIFAAAGTFLFIRLIGDPRVERVPVREGAWLAAPSEGVN